MDRETLYDKPLLTRFGSFRDLTAAGLHGVTDGVTVCGTPCPVAPIDGGERS
ncbi:MAG: lasso RiPP family leader peptide-containing protein [Gemmatimonadota bacterium]|jgi:hypothetical protein|nr:lasso RiPP family leader peptide-containing protein [Gemmatimonadota bacterium]